MDKIYGVITGDIVNSTKMINENLKSLMNSIFIFEQLYNDLYSLKLDTFRGDSF